MKKLNILLIVVALIAVSAVSASATFASPANQVNLGYWHKGHHPGPYPGNGPSNNNPGQWYNPPVYQLKEDARFVLHRTALILMEVQRMAMQRHYGYGLGQSMAHQQKARELYLQGAYREAIFHSLRARNIALQIFAGNREWFGWSYSGEPREENYRRMAPRDEDLDHRLNWLTIHSDDDTLSFHFDIDINF